MPRRKPAIPSGAVQLRQLQACLGDLSVPALLRVRDTVESALARERVRAEDVSAVLESVERSA